MLGDVLWNYNFLGSVLLLAGTSRVWKLNKVIWLNITGEWETNRLGVGLITSPIQALWNTAWHLQSSTPTLCIDVLIIQRTLAQKQHLLLPPSPAESLPTLNPALLIILWRSHSWILLMKSSLDINETLKGYFTKHQRNAILNGGSGVLQQLEKHQMLTAVAMSTMKQMLFLLMVMWGIVKCFLWGVMVFLCFASVSAVVSFLNAT